MSTGPGAARGLVREPPWPPRCQGGAAFCRGGPEAWGGVPRPGAGRGPLQPGARAASALAAGAPLSGSPVPLAGEPVSQGFRACLLTPTCSGTRMFPRQSSQFHTWKRALPLFPGIRVCVWIRNHFVSLGFEEEGHTFAKKIHWLTNMKMLKWFRTRRDQARGCQSAGFFAPPSSPRPLRPAARRLPQLSARTLYIYWERQTRKLCSPCSYP